MVWTIDTPKNKKFVEAFQKRWGDLPSGAAGGSYVAMQIVFEALKKTNGDTSSEALAKALDATNVEAFMGPIRFGDTRVGINTYLIHKVVKTGNDYRTEVIGKYTIKTSKIGNKFVQSVAK